MPHANWDLRRAWLDEYQAKAGYIDCECGCGEQIPAVNRKLKPARFKRGHNRVRVPGDTMRHSAGYVLEYAPDHPDAYRLYVYQHRLVWERANGPLPKGMHIHHINGDRADNRLENLQALTPSEHRRLHIRQRRAAA